MSTTEVIELDSGISYKILESGNGSTKPSPSDTVLTHYEGSLDDGSVFDSSYKRGEPISFGLNQVISGWTEILQHMVEGDKWEVRIPPQLAYGDQELPNIPAGSTLTFIIELLGINP